MEVSIVKSNATVPSIGGDAIPDPDTYYLYSVYQNVPFSIDLTFSLDDTTDPENPIPVAITSISRSLSTYGSVSFTTISSNPYNYTIRVSGTITNAIPGEYYYILQNDNTVTQISAASAPASGYLAIVRWTLPSVFVTLMSNSYQFTINYVGGSETVNMSQYVYWNYDPAIVQFQQVVAQGAI